MATKRAAAGGTGKRRARRTGAETRPRTRRGRRTGRAGSSTSTRGRCCWSSSWGCRTRSRPSASRRKESRAGRSLVGRVDLDDPRFAARATGAHRRPRPALRQHALDASARLHAHRVPAGRAGGRERAILVRRGDRSTVARHREEGGGCYRPVSAAALRLPPRALSVGGTAGSGVSRGRPGPRFTIDVVAAVAGTDGSAIVAGAGAASPATLLERTGRRTMSPPVRRTRRTTPVAAERAPAGFAEEVAALWSRGCAPTPAPSPAVGLRDHLDAVEHRLGRGAVGGDGGERDAAPGQGLGDRRGPVIEQVEVEQGRVGQVGGQAVPGGTIGIRRRCTARAVPGVVSVAPRKFA